VYLINEANTTRVRWLMEFRLLTSLYHEQNDNQLMSSVTLFFSIAIYCCQVFWYKSNTGKLLKFIENALNRNLLQRKKVNTQSSYYTRSEFYIESSYYLLLLSGYFL
jgi:hypothetical protein